MIKKDYVKPDIVEFAIRLESEIMKPSMHVFKPSTDESEEDEDMYIDDNW